MFLRSLCGSRVNRFVRNQPVRVRLLLLLVGIAAMAGSWVARPQAQATCPCSIWSLSAAAGPLVNDPNAVELGVKFRADSSGYITGLRFYKYSQNTGTHVGNLWSSTGTLLGTVTFSNESASGWQNASFPSPVAITANTTYVASYHTNTGFYAATASGLATAVDNAPLHALSDGTSGGNGVYAYGANTGFPNQTFSSTNYWVDPVFATTLGPDVTPP